MVWAASSRPTAPGRRAGDGRSVCQRATAMLQAGRIMESQNSLPWTVMAPVLTYIGGVYGNWRRRGKRRGADNSLGNLLLRSPIRLHRKRPVTTVFLRQPKPVILEEWEVREARKY